MKKAILIVTAASLLASVAPSQHSFAEGSATEVPQVAERRQAIRVETEQETVMFTAAQLRWLRAMTVNNIQYEYGNAAPALQAFRVVATDRGWTPAQIASWEIAIADIMRLESGFCPNVLRGAIVQTFRGCVLKKQGRYEDAGFGQVIAIHYRPASSGRSAGFLCKEEGVCSKWSIVGSPWTSMNALVAMLEKYGVKPWCYSSSARRYHRGACNNPGLDVP